MSSRWLRLLVVAGVIEAVLAVIVRVDEVGRLAEGETTVSTVVAGVGLLWVVVLLSASGAVARQVYLTRSRVAGNEDALSDVASTTADWLWEADPQLRLTYCSPRVADQLGYRPEDLLGVELPSLMSPSDAVRARELQSEALSVKSGWRDVELAWVHADGRLVTLQGSGQPILDRLGNVVGFRGARRPVTQAMALERELAAARARVTATIEGQAFDIALQPIVDVTTGHLRGAEALARFRDGRSPDVWFKEARDAGLALALDRLAFSTAVTQAGVRLPSDAYLSVNATPELILDAEWKRLLLDGGFDLERLVIEVTEHVEIRRYDEIRDALVPLRERGVRLAVDDTGAGYASFSHVLHLHPDIIKIDRSLISHIAHDPARRAIVTSLCLLALELDASLTAEGVESATELDMLASLGVDCAQGHFLGRPTIDQRRWRGWAKKVWATAGRRDEASPATPALR